MINREAVVGRHSITYHQPQHEAPLSVGNGEFAFTADITGLQTFADSYERATGRALGRSNMPLGTQAQWAYHWAPNPDRYRLEDTFEEYEGRQGKMVYPTKYDYNHSKQESLDAGNGPGYYFWANPQRVHLAKIGFAFNETLAGTTERDILGSTQELSLWDGLLTSNFTIGDLPVRTLVSALPDRDAVVITVESEHLLSGNLALEVAFPYVEESFEAPPLWDRTDAHSTTFTQEGNIARWQRKMSETTYWAQASSDQPFNTQQNDEHTFTISFTNTRKATVVVEFSPEIPCEPRTEFSNIYHEVAQDWHKFWNSGAFLDFENATDPRAAELERRIVLSLYQTRINCSGSTPPQETGLVCNSWGGTFHLEMHWWHAAHFAMWGRPKLLENSLRWYESILDVAQENARRNGFRGARWPKHVGPEGIDSPNWIGPLLVWQQPHLIYFAELIYHTASPQERESVLHKYEDLVEQTTEFLASFVWHDDDASAHLAPPLVPAQEIYGITDSWDPLFETAYFRWGIETGQKWRERLGKPKRSDWSQTAQGLTLPVSSEGIYHAVQRPPRTERTDHPSLIGALGFVPDIGIVDHGAMRRTLDDVIENWRWSHTWGWDYPLLAMCAARLGDFELAIDLLLRDENRNTFLPNGHNLQAPNRLPLYLPGNGGLLAAASLIFAGWDHADGSHITLPQPETWQVLSENFPPKP